MKNYALCLFVFAADMAVSLAKTRRVERGRADYASDPLPKAVRGSQRNHVPRERGRFLFEKKMNMVKHDYVKKFQGDSAGTPNSAPITPAPSTGLQGDSQTLEPSPSPSSGPTRAPIDSTESPTILPSAGPTLAPSTQQPSANPTVAPSTEAPSSLAPTESPTGGFSLDGIPARTCPDAFAGTMFETLNDQLVDIDQEGFGTVGDVFIWDNNAVRLSASPNVRGFSAGRCVLLEDEGASEALDNFYCSVSFYLGEDGGFVLQGVFYEPLVGGGVDCFEGTVGEVDYGFAGSEFTYVVTVQDETTYDASECPDGLLINQWEESINDVFLDWEKNVAPNPGDAFIFNSSALSTGTGLDGTVQGECMFLELTTNTERIFCTSTFRITETGDQLVVMGLFNSLTIIGGSGCFLNARGIVKGADSSVGKLFYNLALDDANSAQDPSCIRGIFANSWREEIGDVFVDYFQNDGAEDAGEVYVFDNKRLTIPLTGGATTTGLLAGRCFVTTANHELFCQYAIEAPGGTIITQGLFSNMLVVGASGCYQGLNAYLQGGIDEQSLQFVYQWKLV